VALTVTVLPADAATVPPSAAATLGNANPADNTPHAQSGEVRAFAQVGTKVYVGGTFTNIKAAGAASWTSRPYLFAYDSGTGAINTTFLPQLDGSVSALAISPDGQKLIVAGSFRNVGGVARRNLVALDLNTGTMIASWTGRGDGGTIRRAIVRGNYLYVAGSFLYINGSAHSLFARLNANTGAIDNTFQINASVPRAGGSVFGWALAISPDGNTMVGGGNFTQVNGQARNQIFVAENLNGTPAVANWSTQRYVAPCYSGSFPYYVQDIDFSDDGSYFAVSANGGRDATAYCDSVSRWETSARGSTIEATWVDFTGTDSVTSVEAADNVVYAGGHFRWMNNPNGNDAAGPGAIDRFGYAALDPSNGLPFNWNPTRTAGGALPPGGTAWGPQVTELWKGTNGIYAGFDNDGTANEYHGRMALFPYAGGRTVAAANPYPNASGFLYVRANSTQLAKVSFNGTTAGAPTLTNQPNLAGSGAMFNYGGNRFWWSKTDASAPSGRMVLSQISGGTYGASWLTSYSAWFGSAQMTGAFARDGRMYYTKAGNNSLFYRYLENDGNTIGATEFTLPTQNLAWGNVRGLAWVNGRVVYGNTDGVLRSVAFDATAASGFAVDGAGATVVAGSAGTTWNSPTLVFAIS
jgi:hypothetical protein